MGIDNERNVPLEQAFREQDWRQGSLFQAPELPCARYDVTRSGEIERKVRRLKPGDRYVVATHDCDIVRTADLEPFVEAVLCTVEPRADFIQRLEANRNSARWFVVDPESGLVAHANYRVTVAKKLLPRFGPPKPWPGGSERFAWFRWWLGYRFDRPSLEWYEENHLRAPIQETLDALGDDAPVMLTTFFRAVQEVRVVGPSRLEAPFDFQLVLLTGSPSLTSAEAEAIDLVMHRIRSRLDSEPIELDADMILAAVQEFSVVEYRRSWLLPLDQYADTRGEDDT